MPAYPFILKHSTNTAFVLFLASSYFLLMQFFLRACACVSALHPSRVQRYEKYFKYASILEENLNFSSFCRGKGSFACKKKAETYVSALVITSLVRTVCYCSFNNCSIFCMSSYATGFSASKSSRDTS